MTEKRCLEKGEKMSKKMVFILLIIAVAVGGFLAYTQTRLLL